VGIILEQSDASKIRNSLSNLLSNTFWALVSTGFLVLAGFITNIIVGNKLGEELYGVYSLSATIYILVGMVFFVGIPFSLAKYSAEFIESNEINQQYYTASLIAIIITTAIGGILLYSSRFIIAEIFTIPEFVRIIPLLAIGLPFLGIYRTGISRLNGLREMRKMALGDTLRYVLFLILTIVFVSILDGGIYWAVFSLILSDILVCPFIIWSTKLKQEWDIRNFRDRFFRLGWFGSQIVLARIVEELDVRSSILLVGLFLSKTDVGLYSLASLIASAISVIPQAIQKVTGPAMTELYASKRIVAIKSMMNQVMKLSMFFLTFIACTLVMFFDNTINLLYPKQPGFLDATGIFQILAIGAIFYGTTVSISPIFLSMERADITLRIAIIRVITTVAITLFAIKPLGVIGAAFGGAGTGLIVFASWIYYIQKLLLIKIEWRSMITISILGIVMVILTKQINGNISVSWLNYLVNMISLGVYSILVIKFWKLDKYIKIITKPFVSFSNHSST
jgi:stage V sporulation protein B